MVQHVTRRELLQRVSLVAGGAVLAADGPPATPPLSGQAALTAPAVANAPAG